MTETTTPTTPAAAKVETLLSLTVGDVASATLAEEVRRAYAGSIGKPFAELDPAQQAEANRWAAALGTMVRLHRGGAGVVSIVRAPGGVVQANMQSGSGKESHASGTLVLSGEVAAPLPPRREPKPPSAAGKPLSAKGPVRQPPSLPRGSQAATLKTVRGRPTS